MKIFLHSVENVYNAIKNYKNNFMFMYIMHFYENMYSFIIFFKSM